MTRFLGRHSDVETHLERLRALGHDVRIVEAGHDKDSSLEAFARGLDLPSWFGHNWDALADSLRELEGTDGRPLELVWDHVHELREREPDAYATALEILREVQADRVDLGVTVIDR